MRERKKNNLKANSVKDGDVNKLIFNHLFYFNM